ncbi:MAG: glutathione S-transferase [Candidatus Puniceispirillaceae bacterium]
MTTKPVLWSFRRCPYAMRARLAIKAAAIDVHLREILLRDKPEPFIKASAKATVPVLVLADGSVIDQSLDIMFWALKQSDPQGWLHIWHDDRDAVQAHFDSLDNDFKHHLDRYKYATRYQGADAELHRMKGAEWLSGWDAKLAEQPALSGDNQGIVDFGTLPFIRQFRIADPKWFDAQDWPYLHRWLNDFLDSDRFAAIMEKYEPWKQTKADIAF